MSTPRAARPRATSKLKTRRTLAQCSWVQLLTTRPGVSATSFSGSVPPRADGSRRRSAGALHHERVRALRALLTHAAEHSPWHRERLPRGGVGRVERSTRRLRLRMGSVGDLVGVDRRVPTTRVGRRPDTRRRSSCGSGRRGVESDAPLRCDRPDILSAARVSASVPCQSAARTDRRRPQRARTHDPDGFQLVSGTTGGNVAPLRP